MNDKVSVEISCQRFTFHEVTRLIGREGHLQSKYKTKVFDLLPDNLNKDSVNVVTSGESDSISCSSTFDVTSQIERKLPTPSHSNNELEISFLQKNKPSDKTLNPISNCKTRQMDIFNSERKKVTITDPCDKLTRDIQLKAEKILSDLRSVPLKYADKINKTRGVKSLENVLLQEKEVEDDVSDGGGGGSNDINDDSDDLLNELPKRKFPRISGQLNRKQLNSPENS
ncbi:unnamed protein product [Heterobilharzia americana]|nr:unnamed protein product [Heterobilharzia americana]